MEKEGKSLVKRHAFGARSDVKGSLGWLDEGTLMYPVGKAVALHTIVTNNQRFLEASYQSTGVTALAASANKKFIAIAEGGENPQIQIIDTTTRKRRKVLTVSDLGSDRFTAMAFSADGRHLVTQGGAPSWNLFYWNWERSKPLASISIAAVLEGEQTSTNAESATNANAAAAALLHEPLVTNVAVCPGDALTVTISGVGLLRFYKYTDGFLQPEPSCGYPHEQQEVFLTHAWLGAELLVASSKSRGDLLLIERGRYVGRIVNPVNSGGIMNYSAASVGNGVEVENNVVVSIVPMQNGFVAGSSNGAVSVYERNTNLNHMHYAETANGEEEEEDNPASRMFVLLCTLQVPEREPGEPADLVPHQDPNSTHGPNNKSGAGARRLEKAGGDGVGSAGGGFDGTFSATTTRSGKPRRFHVAPPIPGAQSVLGVSAACQGGAGDAGGGASAAAGGAGAGGQASAGAPGSASQDASGALMGAPISVKLGYGVASMALDQGEETLAVLTNAGKIYSLDFRQHWAHVQREIDSQEPNAGVGKASPGENGGGKAIPGAESSGNGLGGPANPSAGGSAIPSFEPVCEPFHTGSINGMSCSVRKPFLMTSSSDHSVRLWNTSTHKMEMCVFFREEPGAVAIHPSGLMAIVCFPDCVRVMSVLWNSLRDRRVINYRHASDVAFSHGGHFFSITHGNLVDLFHSTTCEPHGQLRGHPQKVRDLKWCSTSLYPTDNSLITCSMDGMIMYWSSQDARKEAEHSDNKRYQYLAIAADDRYVWALASPTSAISLEVHWKVTLREMDRHVLGLPNASSEDYEFTDTALTSLLIASHQRVLFGGGDDGSLKVMSLPLAVGVQEAPLPAHGARVTRMAISHDEATLFTGGADGSIFFWEIRDESNRGIGGAGAAMGNATATGAAAGGGGRIGGGGGDNFQYGTNEVLVTQQEQEEQKLELESLQQTIEKLKTDIDSEEKRRNHEQGTRLRERMEEYRGDAAALAAEYAAVWNSKAEQERSFIAIKLEKEAEAARAMELTETTHQAEVQALETMCNELQYTVEKEQIKHAQELQSLQESIQAEEDADRERYQDIVSQRKEVLEKLGRQAARARQTNQETIHQLELDTDAEAQEAGGKHQRELNVLRERFLHMKGEGAIMRKNAARMEREIDVRSGELRLLDSAKTALSAQLSELSQHMAQLHQDIDERDAVIGEKEKTIYALKKHNQELEKYKFVLDHRIRQLKAQMEPKQREIMQHNQQIKARNSELESLHENNLTLRANIECLKTDLSNQQVLTKQLLKEMKDFDTYKARYLRDVGEIAPALQEPAQLREVIERLYATHVAGRGGERVAAADPQIRQEFQEQLEYLSTSVGALRKKVKADQERHKKEVSAMMTENLSLIKEIHMLRSEIQELRTVVASEDATRRAAGVLSAGGGRRTLGGDRKQKLRQLAHTGDDHSAAEGEEEGLYNATADGGTLAAGGASTSSSPAASVGGKEKSKSKANPMPSSSALHPHPPGSTHGTGSVEASTPGKGTASAHHHGGRNLPGGHRGRGKEGRAPDPPKIIEENRMELRMLRAYIEVLEKAMTETQKPLSSSLLPGQRLPPISSANGDPQLALQP